jgi:hypothetical protein
LQENPGSSSEACVQEDRLIFAPGVRSGDPGAVVQIPATANCDDAGPASALFDQIKAAAELEEEMCSAEFSRSEDEPTSPSHFFLQQWENQVPRTSLNRFAQVDQLSEQRPPVRGDGVFSIDHLVLAEGGSGPFSRSSLRCWSVRGDQIAAFAVWSYWDDQLISQSAGSVTDRGAMVRMSHLWRATTVQDDACTLDEYSVEGRCSPGQIVRIFELGVPEANYLLAQFFLDSSQPHSDKLTGERFLERAARAGHAQAWSDYIYMTRGRRPFFRPSLPE